MVGLKDIFALIEALVWPLVVAGILIGFRKPLSAFLTEIAQRATKLSITSVFALELPLPEASRSESDPFVSVLPIFAAGGDALISPSEELLSKIGGDQALDYVVFDLGTGHSWLTSRLYIFAVMLQRMRDLRCIVFLETRGNVAHRFLGTASPGDIQLALARRYPWLEGTYLTARTQVEIFNETASQLKPGKLETNMASQLIVLFLNAVRVFNPDKDNPPAPVNKQTWEYIETKNEHGVIQYWEHAKWIDRNRLERDLGHALHKSDKAWCEDSPDISQAKRTQAILRREGPFVALVNKEGVFQSLIDRKALLDQVAERAGMVSDEE